jgi:hypothetical protein
MNKPFKLRNGNKPDKKGFFGTLIEISPMGRFVKKAKKAYKTYKANKPK